MRIVVRRRLTAGRFLKRGILRDSPAAGGKKRQIESNEGEND